MHMLTPKPSSYYTGLGKSIFANPLYLKKAQMEKSCLYNVKCDKNDLANLFALDYEETLRLAKKSRSKQSVFAKPHPVNALDPSRYSLNPVSKSTPKELVGSNDIVHNYYLEEDNEKAQIGKDKALDTKPNVQNYARLPNTANGSKLKCWNSYQQPRNWPPSMSIHVSNRAINIAEPPRNHNPSLKLNDLACPTCKKCPSYTSLERRVIMLSFGADLILIDPTKAMRGIVKKAYDLLENTLDASMLQQFSNPTKTKVVFYNLSRQVDHQKRIIFLFSQNNAPKSGPNRPSFMKWSHKVIGINMVPNQSNKTPLSSVIA
ncbi:GRIP and coiled-coil domain-containing protein [Tanacetum coccineum]